MVTSSNCAYYHFTADSIEELPDPCPAIGSTANVGGKSYICAGDGWTEMARAVDLPPVGSLVFWPKDDPAPAGWEATPVLLGPLNAYRLIKRL